MKTKRVINYNFIICNIRHYLYDIVIFYDIVILLQYT